MKTTNHTPEIGKLRWRVSVQSPVQVATGTANETQTKYTVDRVVWASIEQWVGSDRGGEPEYAYGQQSERTHTITLRVYRGILPTWRIVFRNRVFNILVVGQVNEEYDWTVCHCKEVVGADPSLLLV